MRFVDVLKSIRDKRHSEFFLVNFKWIFALTLLEGKCKKMHGYGSMNTSVCHEGYVFHMWG